MAVNLNLLSLTLKTMDRFRVIPLIILTLISNAYADEIHHCVKPQCYLFTKANLSQTVKVRMDGDVTFVKSTTFCFEGLQQSLWYIFANPVLRISANESSIKPNSKFLTFYGMSVEDVETRKKQPGYAMLQSWMSTLHTMKEVDDYSMAAFNTSCLVIETDIDYRAKINLKVIYLWYLAYLATGIIMFFSAKTWSHNTTLHYGTGVSLGVLASLLILVFILTKFLPSKFKTFGYILMAVSTSASLWILSSITRFMAEPVAETMIQYWQYVLGYCVVMGVLSFAVVYRYGPVSDERTLNLIQWLLQIIGLVLIYNSTQIREVSAALVILVVTVYNIPRKLFFQNQWLKNWWLRFFPPRVKLLTEEEYILQGKIETKRELDKLREYCRSPDCDAWRIISKLKSPVRFAEFVEGNSWHITEDEMLEYDSGPDPLPAQDNDDDNESEMDFILSSQ